MMATLIFPQADACRFDLAMHISVAGLAQNSQLSNREKWQLAPVSLANVQSVLMSRRSLRF
jgi:hypothetical protein